MRVRAKIGFYLSDSSLRVEPGETADLPAELAKSWAEQGIVELLSSPSYKSKKRSTSRREAEDAAQSSEEGDE